MNKKTLTTAVLAGLTGVAGIVSVANAVHVNPDGTGQVLIYPYYTTRGDNVTLISLVNTSSEVKAVKVRFLEGENSQEVLDFNLYLSPFDVWAANVNEGASGPQISTADNSCTVPQIFDAAVGSGSESFRDSLFGSDSGRSGIDRAREGYLEMIEMGEIASGVDQLGSYAVHTAANPDVNGDPMPLNCARLTQAWQVGGEWASDSTTDFLSGPRGGLFGDGTVVNVQGARAFGYEPVALEHFRSSTAPILHTDPGNVNPKLQDVEPDVSNVVLASGLTAPSNTSDTWSVPIQAVSAVLMTDQIMNEFAVEASILGATEWVATHPTKQFHVWPAGVLIPPFTDTFDEPETGMGDGVACEDFVFDFWDRNEQTVSPEAPPVDFSPSTPGVQPNPQFCYEVNVLTFSNSVPSAGAVGNEAGGILSDALGSRLFTDVDVVGQANFESGWASVKFNGLGNDVDGNGVRDPVIHEMTNETSQRTYFGLPVIGFAVRTAQNDAINALFGAAFEHKYARRIE